ncbi:VOC family protein [Mucilaginibacter ginsenosidivorans]|uniref:Glyoxalase n=1 Tax=Mucilaginibacter ginsenosidivorans TaxID=398053 RepID=A0A5B8UXH3_9SPHI|nr:VOC family protein [Mucilaginibacter ginsenosidivorans]QEC63857.1 glyoxalase [Mucilaginibacter ginsenosidivorans]
MKSISIISIPVTDQEAAKQFYLKLGFNLLVEAPFDKDQKWVQLALSGQEAVSITLVTWFENMPAGCLNGFVINTDNLDNDIEDLSAKGITVGKVDQTPWGRFAAIIDPDGNRLSLHQN